MKASKRDSKALKALLQFSLAATYSTKLKQIESSDLMFLISLNGQFDRLPVKKYDRLLALRKKYFPKEKKKAEAKA